MPELPEVETVRRILAKHVVDAIIRDVRISPAFPGVLNASDGIDAVSTLIGQRITDVQRRGKYLWLPLESGLWIVVHLRMTGRLLVTTADATPVRFEHLAIGLDNRHELRFADQRKFGRVSLVTKEHIEALDARLGIEPLSGDFTAAWLQPRLSHRTGSIKAALLDQHLIAGLGNIYVDEALFASGIYPTSISSAIPFNDLERMVTAITDALTSGIDHQGTTFSTFENPYGEVGGNARNLRVYGKGRKSLPCPTCGQPLDFIRVGGRGTTACTSCQRLIRGPQ